MKLYIAYLIAIPIVLVGLVFIGRSAGIPFVYFYPVFFVVGAALLIGAFIYWRRLRKRQ